MKGEALTSWSEACIQVLEAFADISRLCGPSACGLVVRKSYEYLPEGDPPLECLGGFIDFATPAAAGEYPFCNDIIPADLEFQEREARAGEEVQRKLAPAGMAHDDFTDYGAFFWSAIEELTGMAFPAGARGG